MKTRDFLQDHLKIIYKDFLEYDNRICELNGDFLNPQDFFSGIGYRDKNIQKLYLLRYFAAYFSEYYLIYYKLFIKDYDIHKFNKRNIKILSLGSGSGIDFYALNCLLPKILKHPINIDYTGIDLSDWDYQPSKTKYKFTSNYKFINKSLLEVDSEIFNDTNIIIFPKSISDIFTGSRTKIKDFTKIINYSNISNILIIFSFVYGTPIKGNFEMKLLCEEMDNLGFREKNIFGNKRMYLKVKSPNKLKQYFKFFNIPHEIKSHLMNFNSENFCKYYHYQSDNCSKCPIVKAPMERNTYIGFKAIKFKRSS